MVKANPRAKLFKGTHPSLMALFRIWVSFALRSTVEPLSTLAKRSKEAQEIIRDCLLAKYDTLLLQIVWVDCKKNYVEELKKTWSI
ncbi:hypothetical protein Gogos_009485 [Gossypium gossypioides]|uniref:Uncharacterized protein n=1 Tax=Gossypium gossypioides TaxID=34282 RepID=A0A7J9CF33_GOSGO|nr:hypothetical protein [Gossypium gossypioides]